MKKILIILFSVIFTLESFCQIVDTKYEDGKTGFVDASGNWVVRPKYTSGWWYKEKEVGYYNVGDLKGIIDARGKECTPAKYTEIYCSFMNDAKYGGFFVVANEQKKKGVITLTGKQVVPFEYESLSFYEFKGEDSEEYPKGGYRSIGNKTADESLYYCVHFDKNLKKVFEGDGFFYYVNGTNLLKNAVTRNGKTYWGVIDINGKRILDLKYDKVNILQNAILVCQGDRRSLTDHKGKEILPFSFGYTDIKDGGEDTWLVKNSANKWGYWADGKEIVACQFDQAAPFANGAAMVIAGNKAKQIENPLSGAKVNIAQGGTDPKFEKKIAGKAVSRYPAPNSDVDKDIPLAKAKNENRFAFIIANENYDDAPVPFALNDGRMFAEYCEKALGLPQNHILMYEDATLGNIISAVSKLKTTADVYDGDAEIIFYYAGHGVPDETGESAYILPIDGNPSSIVTTGFGLDKLYKELSEINAKNVMVFVDACFSGAKREDEILTAGRGVRIKVKEETPIGNLVVYSASTGDETAHQLADKGHGLFTYHLLKSLQTEESVMFGDLADNVTKQVKRQSVVINHKRQTPTVIPSAGMINKWRTLKIK